MNDLEVLQPDSFAVQHIQTYFPSTLDDQITEFNMEQI